MIPPTNNWRTVVKTNKTSFLCGNRNGHHNMYFKTHNRTTQKTKKMSNTDRIPDLELHQL